MTDPITCPDCDGEGEHKLGPMRFLCHFCHGTGEVGGDNEPAERGDVHESSPPDPVWDQLGSDAIPGCSICLGTGRVIGLGGNVEGGTAQTMAECPCPVCRDRSVDTTSTSAQTG